MKSNFLALLAGIFLFSLFSCSKGNSPGSNNNNNNGKGPFGAVSTYLLKQAIVAQYDTVNEVQVDSVIGQYSYDTASRLQVLANSEFLSSLAPSLDTGFFTYISSLISLRQDVALPGGGLKGEANLTTYYPNKQSGYADSSFETVASVPGGAAGPVSFLTDYSYDANGYQAQEKEYQRINGVTTLYGTTTYTVSNGNTTRIDLAETSGATETQTFSFGSYPNSMAYYTTHIAATGKPNTNLVTSTTIKTTSTGGTNYSYTLNYSYMFDSQDRVVQFMAKTSSGRLQTRGYLTYY